MAIKLVLNSEQISDKVFKGVPRGYDPYEVDKFLDTIMLDYEKVETNHLLSKNELEYFERTIANLKKENESLKLEFEKFKTKYEGVKPTDNVTEENIDLIKKINKLETLLWQNGINPNSIK